MALLSASVVLGHLVGRSGGTGGAPRECCCSEKSLSKTDVVGKFVEKASNNQSMGRRTSLSFALEKISRPSIRESP